MLHAAALRRWPQQQPWLFVTLAAAVWILAYRALVPFADTVVAALPVDPNGRLAAALRFFAYDTPKVLLLLSAVVFAMGIVNTYFTPERTRALLAGRAEGVGNVMAASLGIVTPFCSCSAVPLFIGFVQAGVPLGVTFLSSSRHPWSTRWRWRCCWPCLAGRSQPCTSRWDLRSRSSPAGR